MIIIIVVLTNSCTTQKINIVGKPNTEIYSRSMQKIGTISDTGILKVVLDKDDVNDIFVSRDEGSDIYIPFLLNFTKRNDYEIGAAIGIITCIPTFMATSPLFALRSSQSEYHFKYLPKQKTNQDVFFTPLRQTAKYKILD